MKILFICKSRAKTPSTYTHQYSGLYNSTSHLSHAISAHGIHSKVVDVIDNNCIDKEVSKFKPNIVIIEALWVVPEKFNILKRIHPRVRWFVHLHSNVPFLANEGMAIDWLFKYQKHNVGIIVNADEASDAITPLIYNVVNLPNVYVAKFSHKCEETKEQLNIACFGAIRPLKNQLLQAMAAIQFADDLNMQLNFHINATRVEHGDSILKNIESLFRHTKKTNLVKHPWHNPKDLPQVLSHMDIGMQVSLSETFNVVTADYVSAGIPVVVSPQIHWVSKYSQSDPYSIREIISTMHYAYQNKVLVQWNQFWLKRLETQNTKKWIEFLRGC